MPTKTYNIFGYKVARGEIALHSADVRVALVMENTTCGTENDGISSLADFTTLDECDGANYSRVALTTQTVTLDDANDRTVFDVNDVEWSALGAGTRKIKGALFYVYGATDDVSTPICYLEYATARTADDSDFLVSWPATGVMVGNTGNAA
jgi:hypothetical protein